MCMPVIPRSKKPVDLAEAHSWRAVHDIRIGLHLMERADRDAILDKPGIVSLSDMESYLDNATKALTTVLTAYYTLRQSVRQWRSEDNAEGAKEYVI